MGTIPNGAHRYELCRLTDLTDESLGALVELERLVHRESAHYDDRPWDLENFTRPLPGKQELSLVVMESGKPVGFLVASSRPDGVHVNRVAVDPRHRGMGVAAWLIARLFAQSSGTVTINCDPGNQPAIALYTRAGFRVRGTTPAGKLLLSTDPLIPVEKLCVWYVFTTAGMRSGHAAHVPGFVDTLSHTCRATAVRYGDPTELPPLRLSLDWVRAFLRLAARARREGVDVIFVRIHWKLAALLWLAGRMGGGWRVALWSSGGVGVLSGARLGLRARAGRLVHRQVLRRMVDAVVTGPPRLIDQYAGRYGLGRDRMLLACNDVNGEALRTLTDGPELAWGPVVRRWLKSPHRFLYVHSLDAIRGADRLPRLLAEIRTDLPDAEVLVLGDGPLFSRLAPEPVLMAGRVPNDVVVRVMAQAGCLLVPSRQEGFPRVLVEAMAVGTPCVSFDVGGCADVMGELRDRYVAPDGDLERMAELAVAAARTPLPEAARTALVQRAAVFDTEPVASALAVTLRSLRSQGAGPAALLSRSLWRPAFPRRND
ncbi:GNAT family N-acetyltransferase [Streptomyces sp. MUM 178J]|uniref:GNAT family N-acetyltransferase n=1 Tax=Streptomyces sp. MUM 178J TaxID=2791991 RepID=UPI001F038E40|nr:GNAT family N-acetyltransferase [Streptomyces sp. MUM 178J]WRQ82214.1 GNAT family N-acetyltransferase [Streptomyces sp. MUM 178J]